MVKWISQWSSEPLLGVRVPPGAPNRHSSGRTRLHPHRRLLYNMFMNQDPNIFSKVADELINSGSQADSKEAEPRLELNIRIHPDNLKMSPSSPGYVEHFEKSLEQLRTQFLREIQQGVEAGTITLPVTSEQKSDSVSLVEFFYRTPEAAMVTMAYEQALHQLNIETILCGYGMIGALDGYRHGVAIRHILDESVPVGGYRIDGDQELAAKAIARL